MYIRTFPIPPKGPLPLDILSFVPVKTTKVYKGILYKGHTIYPIDLSLSVKTICTLQAGGRPGVISLPFSLCVLCSKISRSLSFLSFHSCTQFISSCLSRLLISFVCLVLSSMESCTLHYLANRVRKCALFSQNI